jgi:hypothetical protein
MLAGAVLQHVNEDKNDEAEIAQALSQSYSDHSMSLRDLNAVTGTTYGVCGQSTSQLVRPIYGIMSSQLASLAY